MSDMDYLAHWCAIHCFGSLCRPVTLGRPGPILCRTLRFSHPMITTRRPHCPKWAWVEAARSSACWRGGGVADHVPRPMVPSTRHRPRPLWSEWPAGLFMDGRDDLVWRGREKAEEFIVLCAVSHFPHARPWCPEPCEKHQRPVNASRKPGVGHAPTFDLAGGSGSAKDVKGTTQRLAAPSQRRQCGEPTFRILVRPDHNSSHRQAVMAFPQVARAISRARLRPPGQQASRSGIDI